MSFALSTCPLALGCATDTYFTTMLLSSQKVLECTTSELSPQVCDDAIGEAETMYDLVEEFDRFF
jgi:hypothetical protein